MLFYEAVADVAEKAPLHIEAHSARLREFHDRGELLMVGPWTDGEPGAMAVFLTLESADEFVADDPFLTGGVVASWRIRQWDETFT